MTVYVDDMRARFDRMVMCHLGADTLEELHAFAAAIGCRRHWFQGDHYDVPLFRRARAVRLGAVEVTRRDMVRMVRRPRRAPVDGGEESGATSSPQPTAAPACSACYTAPPRLLGAAFVERGLRYVRVQCRECGRTRRRRELSEAAE